jgi:hypothetical protein
MRHFYFEYGLKSGFLGVSEVLNSVTEINNYFYLIQLQ